VTKILAATTKYRQVGFQCFVDRKLNFKMQIFVGSSSENSRPACICGTERLRTWIEKADHDLRTAVVINKFKVSARFT
jgi:hypothetical protein